MVIASPAAIAAERAYDFVSTLGINTHIDLANYGYQNLATVESSINYLGVKNIRDSAETVTDAQTWLQVSQATGAKFDDYIAETSPSGMSVCLSYVKQLAAEGILDFIEGGNEEDDAYSTALGNTLQITAQFQQRVYAAGQALGLPVINMSFGSGWTPVNNYQGNYAAVGDLSAYADFGNAHSYPNVGQGTDWSTQRLNGLAKLADGTDPVITTEIGWNESQGYGQANIAKYVVQAALDGMKDGNVKTYFYSLFDDGSGLFGLMNQDGTPKPAGVALHDLTSLLADTGTTTSTFTPGSLSYTLAGTTANDNSLLMEKADGSYWLSLWNENDAVHNVTLTLGGTAAEIKVFNPVTGISALQDVKGVASVTVSMSDTPLIVEIVGAGAAPPPTATTDTGGSTGTPPAILGVTTTPGNGGSVATGGVVTLTVAFSSTVTVAGGSPTLALSPGGVATYVSGSGHSALVFSYTVAAGQTAADLALATSNALALNGATIRGAAGNNAVLTGANGVNPARTVQINPATGGGAGGATTPNFITPGSGSFTDSAGNVYSIDAAGNAIENGTLIPDGDSTGAMEYSNGTVYGEYLTTGTWYTWNQSVWAGPVAPPPPPGTPPVSMTGGSAPAAPTITGTSGDDNIVATVNNTTINSGAGNDSIFLSGTGDVVTTGNGTNTVMGFVGGNTITTGSGNDIIRIGGSGSVVNAGPGVNMISDSGNGNTFVLPASGGTDNIFGYVLQNNGLFDLRPLLAATTWNRSQATLGHYIQTTASPGGANTMLVVTPSGGAAGASYTAATFNGSGVISLPTLLSQSLT